MSVTAPTPIASRRQVILPDAVDVPDKECPKCKAAQKTSGLDISAGRAPSVGGSNTVKAMDMAANLVMEDHGMTDLSSDGREGAIMAPKLPPASSSAQMRCLASPQIGNNAISSRVQRDGSGRAARERPWGHLQGRRTPERPIRWKWSTAPGKSRP